MYSLKSFGLLLVFALLGNSGFAQELKGNSIDPFTGKLSRFTDWYRIGYCQNYQHRILMCAGREDEEYFFGVFSLGIKELSLCSGAANNYVIFLFTDGTKFTVEEDFSNIDCGDAPSSWYKVADANVFAGKEVAKIRMRQGDTIIDYDFGAGKGGYAAEFQPSQLFTVLQAE
jgi:hypothetical protein